MNQKENPFSHLDLPEIGQTRDHKKRLRAALLLAHQDRSTIQVFGAIVHNTIQTMSKLQKGLAFSTLAIIGLIVAAGIFGPSAYSVAHAEAQEIINRAFAHLADLSDEDRTALKEKFQERMQFKGKTHGKFMGMKELSPEEFEAKHELMQTSLVEALVEAQTATDLQIISADELPVSGFFGRAGRTFRFKMMRTPENLEEKLASLPEDVRQKIEEHATLREGMMPVSFMVYTNADGQTVYLGLNDNDEPVVKFVQPKEGEFPFSPHDNKFSFWGDKGHIE